MFIQRAPPATFAWTFMKTLFTNAATANRALMALININEFIYLKIKPSVFFKISCFRVSL